MDTEGARGGELEQMLVTTIGAFSSDVERNLVGCQGLRWLTGLFVGLPLQVAQAGFEFSDVVSLAEREGLVDVGEGCVVLLFEKARQGAAVEGEDLFAVEQAALCQAEGQAEEELPLPRPSVQRVSQTQGRVCSGSPCVALGQGKDAGCPRELLDYLLKVNAWLIVVKNKVEAGFCFPEEGAPIEFKEGAVREGGATLRGGAGGALRC